MIESTYPNEGYLVSCDFCSEEIEVNADAWFDMLKRIKAKGWKFWKDDSGWVHSCPECVKEEE